MDNSLVEYETLMRGPENGNRRSSRLRDEAETVQLSGKTVYNVNDEMWWLHVKGWFAGVHSDLASRSATWHHLLINGMTLGIDAAVTAATDDEAWKRASRSMIERGVWLP